MVLASEEELQADDATTPSTVNHTPITPPHCEFVGATSYSDLLCKYCSLCEVAPTKSGFRCYSNPIRVSIRVMLADAGQWVKERLGPIMHICVCISLAKGYFDSGTML